MEGRFCEIVLRTLNFLGLHLETSLKVIFVFMHKKMGELKFVQLRMVGFSVPYFAYKTLHMDLDELTQHWQLNASFPNLLVPDDLPSCEVDRLTDIVVVTQEH